MALHVFYTFYFLKKKFRSGKISVGRSVWKTLNTFYFLKNIFGRAKSRSVGRENFLILKTFYILKTFSVGRQNTVGRWRTSKQSFFLPHCHPQKNKNTLDSNKYVLDGWAHSERLFKGVWSDHLWIHPFKWSF